MSAAASVVGSVWTYFFQVSVAYGFSEYDSVCSVDRVIFVFGTPRPRSRNVLVSFYKALYLIQYDGAMDGSCLTVCGLLLGLVLYHFSGTLWRVLLLQKDRYYPDRRDSSSRSALENAYLSRGNLQTWLRGCADCSH